MIERWISVIALERQRERLAAAEQHRLGRRARDGKKNGRTVYYRLRFRRFREPSTEPNRRAGPGGTRRGYPGLRRALESDAPPVVGEASRFYVRKVC
jgi:hypothetical protein